MSTFSQTAMLVSLNVKCWTARKEDKKISAEVARDHGTTTDAGRYNKVLVGKEHLEKITKACGELRRYFYENTLPWLDEGIRVLPAANHSAFKAGAAALIDQIDSDKRAFVAAWPDIISDARTRLNGMFNAADYPADIESRFGVRVRFLPVPDASDFRVDIANTERATLQAEIESTLSEASQAAMADLWQRVSDVVKAMAERLAAYRTVIKDGKAVVESPFRDSLIENLRDMAALIPRLNFAGDSRLEEIRQDIESQLLQTTADTLRDNQMVREDVAAKAAEIASRVSEFMAG